MITKPFNSSYGTFFIFFRKHFVEMFFRLAEGQRTNSININIISKTHLITKSLYNLMGSIGSDNSKLRHLTFGAYLLKIIESLNHWSIESQSAQSNSDDNNKQQPMVAFSISCACELHVERKMRWNNGMPHGLYRVGVGRAGYCWGALISSS